MSLDLLVAAVDNRAERPEHESEPAAASTSSDPECDAFCYACRKPGSNDPLEGGDLISCDSCSLAFHVSCRFQRLIKPPASFARPWRCQFCECDRGGSPSAATAAKQLRIGSLSCRGMCARCGTQFGPHAQLINAVGLPGAFIPHECDARRAPDAEPRRALQGKNRLLPRMPALQPCDSLRPSPALVAKHNVTMMRLNDAGGTADPRFDREISCKRRRLDSAASSFEATASPVPALSPTQRLIVG